ADDAAEVRRLSRPRQGRPNGLRTPPAACPASIPGIVERLRPEVKPQRNSAIPLSCGTASTRPPRLRVDFAWRPLAFSLAAGEPGRGLARRPGERRSPILPRTRPRRRRPARAGPTPANLNSTPFDGSTR